MASITADSELMTNYIAAVPVPAGAKFSTVLDENRRPMVISLSNDTVPKLQIIRTGTDGAPVLIGMASLLGITDSDGVQAFDVCQANDLRLFLTIAYGTGTTSSNLILTQAFMPNDVQPNAKLPLLSGSGGNTGRVDSIYITPVNNLSQTDYPTSYIFHQSLDSTRSWGSDITEVAVQSLSAGWSTSNQMANPENVDGILSVTPAANAFGKGLFVLYHTGGQTKLYARFLRPDPNNPGSSITFVTSVWCPPGATCIASFWDPRDRSALLIASPEGLRYMDPRQSMSKTEGGTILTFNSSTVSLISIKQLYVAQDGTQTSVWFRTATEELGYLRGDASQLQAGVVTMLLKADQSSFFAASFAKPDPANGNHGWQVLVSNDDFGNLTMLEQALDSGIWRRTPFYTPSDTQNIAVQSYTITIHAYDDKGESVKKGRVFVTGSSSASLMYNSQNTILQSSGAWYTTDASGSLNFIVASRTLAAQTFRISKLQREDGTDLSISPFSFDPAAKAMATLDEKMVNITTADDFRNTQTQNGNTLFGSDGPSDDDLKAAITALSNIQTAWKDMPSDGSTIKSGSISEDSQIAATSRMAVMVSESVEDELWDAWEWVKQKAADVWDWVVQKVVAGEVKSFLLDCLEKVGEALTWVFDKIKVAWDKVVEWLGFIFGWGDIIECKNTISSLISSGLDLGALKVDQVATKVDNMFVGLLADVDKLTTVPNASTSLSGKSSSAADTDSSLGNVTSSTSFSWAGERMKNGGAGVSTSVVTSQTSGSVETQTWSTVFQPVLDNVRPAFQKVGDDLKALFDKQGSMTTGDFMNLTKDVIKLAIETIRGLVASLFKLVTMLLQKISEYGNASINIPIFSALYKEIANHDLTLFDAISLIIAIPTTIFTKIITKNKPPQFTNMNGNLLGQILLGPDSNGQEATEQQILEFKTLTAGITVSGIMVSTVVHVLKLAYKSITGGTQGAKSVFASSGGFLEVFSILIDMAGVLHALPDEADLPGAQYREAIASISLIRGAMHLLVLYTGGGEVVDDALLVYDLLSGLTNFGLQQATYAAEIDAKNTWTDYDDETNSLGIVSSGMNAIAVVGYFGAFIAKLEEPEIAAVGMAVLEVGTVGKAVIDGVMFNRTYDQGKATLLMPPSV